MSVDDQVLRDPRVLRLAKLCEWTKRYTLGSLLEVWALCYDRVDEHLPIVDVDVTADLDGFASKMIVAGLASAVRGKAAVRIAGAEERINYLRNQATAGRKGGLKSAEIRREKSKGRLSDPSSGGSSPVEGCAKPPSPPSPPVDPLPRSAVASPVSLEETIATLGLGAGWAAFDAKAGAADLPVLDGERGEP